jgi:hypothetical protein
MKRVLIFALACLPNICFAHGSPGSIVTVPSAIITLGIVVWILSKVGTDMLPKTILMGIITLPIWGIGIVLLWGIVTSLVMAVLSVF